MSAKKSCPAFSPSPTIPRVTTFGDTWLSGSYQYDDEGQKAERVDLIQDGVLKTFLMSRLPIASFGASNGHGRAESGHVPTGRQGNLIVTSTKTVSDAELRKQLIEEAKKQGKPYGLYFEDISSGFAVTQRSSPQAFQVIPLVVWRVYVDGRPDELVRGVSIVGTPLAAMKSILATGDKSEVFNGECGAESGTDSRQRRRSRHAAQRNRDAAPAARHRAPADPAHPRRGSRRPQPRRPNEARSNSEDESLGAPS